MDGEGVEEVANSAGPASAIQPIDRGSVHRICSGQVVLNLATAIKELVENSVDAGANNIEVRLKDYGSELVEVVDNGSGVDEANFQGLTLKHHTSKLKDFSDLTSVDTFGFRGEALSSLCALSNLSITTCHEKASVGTKLEYDYHGKIVQQTPCARQRGTTVCLQNLFHTLPVRHKEFQRNLKKEFAKMAQVLSAYCIIATGVRITCTNQVGKGKKNIIVSTNGNDTMKENITNIFGAKQLQSLLEFKQYSPQEDVCTEYNINVPEEDKKVFIIQGFVSTVEHGHGRGSTDRQFYFVNKRPCDLAKVSRVVNEAYHQFNRYQYPFAVLDISLEKDAVDVNVTPDKRQIFLQEEKLLLATIKSSLMKIFEPKASVYQMNQPGFKGSLVSKFSRQPSLGSSPSPLKKHSSCPESSKGSLTSTLAGMKRSFSSSFARESPPGKRSDESEPVSKQRRLDGFVSKSQTKLPPIVSTNTTDSPQNISFTDGNQTKTASQTPSKLKSVLDFPDSDKQDDTKVIENDTGSGSSVSQESGVDVSLDSQRSASTANEDLITVSPTLSGDSAELESCAAEELSVVVGNENLINRSTDKPSSNNDSFDRSSPSRLRTQVIFIDQDFSKEPCKSEDSDPVENLKGSPCDSKIKLISDSCVASTSEHVQEPTTAITTLYDTAGNVEKPKVTVPFTFSRLRKTLENKKKMKEKEKVRVRGFRAKITPGDNQSAEDELKKEIRKDMFPHMEILGQFNLGFIIAKLDQDLFIIDQHATDEKYNFEMLQRNTVIKSQKLIQPQNLELTAANECILIDNLEIFQKNGFDFLIDEQGPPTQRVKLTAMPVSQNWTFGKDDIEELIFMLSDSPGVLCRPTRVRAMFASRSCRKSIMIGTALNHSEMKKLVGHMAEIDQPWNCPHGRPTMRHLINLNTLPD